MINNSPYFNHSSIPSSWFSQKMNLVSRQLYRKCVMLYDYLNWLLKYYHNTFLWVQFICSNIFIELEYLLWYISNLHNLFHSFLEEKINDIVRRCTQNLCSSQMIFSYQVFHIPCVFIIFNRDDKPFNFMKLKKNIEISY